MRKLRINYTQYITTVRTVKTQANKMECVIGLILCVFVFFFKLHACVCLSSGKYTTLFYRQNNNSS